MYDICCCATFRFAPRWQILEVVPLFVYRKLLLLVSSSSSELVSECEPTRGDTSNDILFLRCDPGVNSQLLRPINIFAVEKRVGSPSADCGVLASCDVIHGIAGDAGHPSFRAAF